MRSTEMALLYHRVHRLKLLKGLDAETSFCILRRMPDMATLVSKADNARKPIRYTSIKKAKPKTITDIGNLLLQRAGKAKEIQQLEIGEAALKDASNAIATSGPSPAHSNTVADKKPVIKAVPGLSVISTPEFTATVNRCVFETSTGGKKRETETQTDTDPSVSRDKLSTKASASSELSPHVSTLFSVSLEERTESTHISSTHHALPETSPALASETYFGILPTAGTLIPNPGEVPDLSHALSPAINDSTEATSASGDTEITHAAKDATSTMEVSVSDINDITPMQERASLENTDGPNMCTHRIHGPLSTSDVKRSQTQGIAPNLLVSAETINVTGYAVQELGSLQSPVTRETSTDSTCPSEIPYKEETVGHKCPPEVEIGSAVTFTEPNISPVVPSKDAAIQEETTVFTNQPEMLDAPTEKGPETVFERSIIWSKNSLTRPDPANSVLAEVELRTEGECSVQEGSHAQLDPIQKLFLDKIREFSTKSKACDGLLDVGPENKEAFLEEVTKLRKLYGNGDLSSFPEFTFSEPVLDENES